MNKVKRVLLGFSVLLTIALGILIRYVSNEIYKYHRFITFDDSKGRFDRFFATFQEGTVFLWIIWGVLLVLLILQLLLEFRKER